MTTNTDRETAIDMLTAGTPAAEVADELGLDYDAEHDAVVLDGWIADDGNREVEYPYASSGRGAAEEYVSDGTWGDDDTTQWVTVWAWRIGLRAHADTECAYCSEQATGLDEAGDQSCPQHATHAGPVHMVIEVADVSDIDRASHSVAIEPEEPACSHADGHDWRSPHGLVGGCESNPGVWGHGGSVVAHEVCVRCALARITDGWAQDPETGVQGLTSVRYDRDEYSMADVARSIVEHGTEAEWYGYTSRDGEACEVSVIERWGLYVTHSGDDDGDVYTTVEDACAAAESWAESLDHTDDAAAGADAR